MQLAKKIQLNSAYGALSNVYFRWFNRDLAESITKSGQLSIRWMERGINGYLNKQLKTDGVDYVIACDTDSMYLNLGELVNQTCKGKTTDQIVKYLDTVCEKIFEPFYRPEVARKRSTGGAGLGLAIVRRCVEAFGGRVSAEAVVPHGLCVSISVPVEVS